MEINQRISNSFDAEKIYTSVNFFQVISAMISTHHIHYGTYPVPIVGIWVPHTMGRNRNRKPIVLTKRGALLKWPGRSFMTAREFLGARSGPLAERCLLTSWAFCCQNEELSWSSLELGRGLWWHETSLLAAQRPFTGVEPSWKTISYENHARVLGINIKVGF